MADFFADSPSMLRWVMPSLLGNRCHHNTTTTRRRRRRRKRRREEGAEHGRKERDVSYDYGGGDGGAYVILKVSFLIFSIIISNSQPSQ